MVILTHETQEFELHDFNTVEGVEVIIDHTGKLWVNVNGKCLLRIGKALHATIEDNRLCRVT